MQKSLTSMRNTLIRMTLFFAAATAQSAAAQTGGAASGDWALRCFKENVCIIQTGLMDSRQQQRGDGAQQRLVAQLAIARNEAKDLVAEIRMPTGILIPKGLKASVGGLEFRPTLRTCIPMGCLASFDATRDVLSAMRKGDTFTLVYTEALSGAEISLPFSLKGFSARLEEFQKRKN